MEKIIKIILAVLFFICLLDMPYGFYQLVRFAAMIGFALLAYKTNEINSKTEAVIYVCLAILFQPIVKFSFGRELWNVIDCIVGIGLLLSFIKRKR